MIDIIIPTSGRDTLEKTIDSIQYQASKNDDIIVVGDGIDPQVNFKAYNLGPTNDYGASQRNFGLMVGNNPWIMFIDDDDVYTNNAFDTVKKYLKAPEIHIFKMTYSHLHSNNTLWKTKEIKYGNIGTPMFIVPRIFEKLPPWVGRYGHDLDFIEMFIKLNPDLPITWHDEIISIIRPI